MIIRTVCVLSSTQEWIPAIKQDHEALTRTRPQQQPYSDAYLSGMPAKRRKVCRGGKGKEKVEGGEGEGEGGRGGRGEGEGGGGGGGEGEGGGGEGERRRWRGQGKLYL